MAWNIRTSKQVGADLEILVNQVNVDVAASIVLDATSVAPDGNGERTLVAGTPLRKDTVTKQYKRWVTADGTTDPIRGILSATVRFPDGTSKSDAPAAMTLQKTGEQVSLPVRWNAQADSSVPIDEQFGEIFEQVPEPVT